MKNKLTTKVSLIILMILTFVVLLGVNVSAKSTEITSGTTLLTLRKSGEYVLNEDVTRNIKIPSYSDVTIDLNGHVLCGTGSSSVIINNGSLTIKDSNPAALHYYVVNADGSWTWNDAADKTNAVLYASLTEAPTAGTVVCVPGGAITGGNASYGGGINHVPSSVDSYLIMQGGNIIGNAAKQYGAGVSSKSKTGDTVVPAYLQMKNVRVLGNIVKSDSNNTMGGGVYVNSYLKILDDTQYVDISYNVSVCTAENTSRRAYAGGLYLGENADISDTGEGSILSYLNVVGNTALAQGKCSNAMGGGMVVTCPRMITLASDTILHNRALTTGLRADNKAMAYGGGLLIKNSNADISLKNTVVSDNVVKVATPKDNENYRYAFGGGVCIFEGELIVNDENVLISGNRADATYKAQGAGVYMAGNTIFTMTAGKITGNTIQAFRNDDVNEEEGAGVIVTYDTSTFTVGLNTIIVSNTDSHGCENNVYLRENALIHLGEKVSAGAFPKMCIGVTMANGTGDVTDADDIITGFPTLESIRSYIKYFFSDQAVYALTSDAYHKKIVSVAPTWEVVSAGPFSGKTFGGIIDALDAVGSGSTTLKMLCNAWEYIEVNDGTQLTLDLNGFVLSSANGLCVMKNGGAVTITDLCPVAEHDFIYHKDSAWTLVTYTDANAIAVSEINDDTPDGTLVKVFGGVVTGAENESALGNNNTMTLIGINVIGNYANANNGGGITNGDKGILTLVDCVIAGNKATLGGGVICADSDFGTSNCFVQGTQITMPDGSTKNVEDIQAGDKVLSFNHETGKYESQKVTIAYKGEGKANYFTLHFADGNELSIAGCHDLFAQSVCRYVTLSADNCTDYIGEYFYNAAAEKWVELQSVTFSAEKIEYYSLYVAGTVDCIADGMLSIPDDMEPLMQIYEFNADLTVNAAALQTEIDTYGLVAYEDSPYPMSRELFDALNVRYTNILLGHGYVTAEEIDYVYNEWYRGVTLQPTHAELFGVATNPATLIISGKTLIIHNVNDNDEADNVYLYTGKLIHVDNPNDAMLVGVTPKDCTGIVTDEAADAYAKYFFSDNAAYKAVNVGAMLSQQVYIGKAVAYVSETNVVYETIKDAIDDVGTTPATIVLLRDVQENVEIPENAKITLDLCGHVLSGDGTTSVIVNNGTATITDSYPTTNHYYVVDANGVWQWNDKATKTDAVTFSDLTDIPTAGTIICVPGGAITGGSASNGGGINSNGTLTLDGGTVIGNKVTSSAGGVYVFDSNFTMTGGKVVGNVANNYGGGVFVGKQDSVAGFTMIDGIIYGNKASNGGGVYVYKGDFTMTAGNVVDNKAIGSGGGVYNAVDAAFTMTGGTISDNVAAGPSKVGIVYKDGGGVYNAADATFTMIGGSIHSNVGASAGVYNNGIMTVGGAATITDNVNKDGKASNLYLPSGKTITVTDFNGIVGITTQDAPAAGTPVAFTGEDDANKANFFCDNDAYSVIKSDATLYLCIPVAQIVETGENYVSIYDAIEAAGTTPTTIKLLCDVEENVTIPAGADITLDLCGHVLDLGGKHILNQGILTIEDSDPDAVHIGTLTDYVGGIIANGNAGDVDPILQGIGGAIVVCKNGSDAALIMNAGTIVNCTALNGGAIFVGEGATFTMNGGTITHCTAERGGAIGNYKGSAAIAGTIAYCTATNYGGAIYNEGDDTAAATVILNDGAVIKNCSAYGGADQMGGGIFNKGTLVMNVGAVIENCTAEKGAGVHNHGAAWVTFTMNGGTIQNNTAAKNGGGVQNSDKATFVMNGGTITGNVAKESLAGGVFTKGKMTVQGTASIYGNFSGTATPKASNLAVVKGYPITVASNTGLLYISVIEKDGSYKVTTGNYTIATVTDYNSVFFPDDSDNYEIRSYRNANGIASMLAGKTPVCEITSEGNYTGNRYDTLAQAIADTEAAATPTTIKLLKNITIKSTLSLPDYTTIVFNNHWIEPDHCNLYVGKDNVFEVASEYDIENALWLVGRNGGEKSYTLKLTQDIHVSKPIKVDYGYFKSLTIDGNGYVFTATASDTAPAQSHVLYFYNNVNFYKEIILNNVVINVGNGFRGGICVDKTVDAAIIAVDLDDVTIIADRTKAPLGSDMTERTGTLIQNNGNGILVNGQLKLVTDAYCWSAVDLDKDKGNVTLEFNTGAVISVTDLRTNASKIKEPLVGLSGTSAKQWAVRVPSSGAQLLYATQSDLNPNNVEGLRCKDGYDVEIHTHVWTYTVKGTTITASCTGTAHVCHSIATNTSISIKAPTALTYNGQAKNATLIGTSIVGQDALPAITYQYKTGANGAYAPAANTANAGYYKASVTIGGATAYVEYCVDKVAVYEPTVSGTYVFNGSEQTPSIIGVKGYMTASGTTLATAAGTYTITYTLGNNYKWVSGTDGVVTWTIEKANAAVSLDTTPIVAVYGDKIVLPEGSANVGTVVCSATSGDLINAGSYTVTYTIATTSDYYGDEKTVAVTILPLAVNEPTMEYITRTYTGAQYNVTLSDVAPYMTMHGDVNGTNAGVYTITYTLDNNHVWASGSDGVFTWTIEKAKAVIDVDTTAIVKTYGDDWKLPVATSNVGTVQCNKTQADLANVGTYTVTYTVADTDNFTGDTKTLTVTIKPLAVNEPVVSGAYIYDGTEKKVELTGAEEYMTVTGVNKAISAGTYTLTYTLDNNHVWADGSDGVVTWYVNTVQAQLTVDTTPLVVTYGEKIVLPVASSTFGTVVCDKTAEDLTNVGTYSVTYVVESTADYAGATAVVTVVVNPLAVNEPTVVGSYKFDGTPVTVTVSGVAEYMTLEGSLTQSAAGVYTVSYTLDNNHVWAEGSDGVVTYEIKAASIVCDEAEQGDEKPAVIVETEDGFSDDIILVVVVMEATVTDATEKTETIVDYDNLPNEDLKLKEDEELAVVFDVKLYRIEDGVSYEIQPEDIKPGTVLNVKMLIPSYVDVTKVTRLLHVHAADDIEEIPFDASKIDEDGYYTIAIDRLSEIAFIYEKDDAASKCCIHWIILALLVALVVFVAVLWYVFKIYGFVQDGENKPAPYIGFGLHFVGMVVLAFFAACALCWILLGVNLVALGLSVVLYYKGAKEDTENNGKKA